MGNNKELTISQWSIFIIRYNSPIIWVIAKIICPQWNKGQAYFIVKLLHNVYCVCVELETKDYN